MADQARRFSVIRKALHEENIEPFQKSHGCMTLSDLRRAIVSSFRMTVWTVDLDSVRICHGAHDRRPVWIMSKQDQCYHPWQRCMITRTYTHIYLTSKTAILKKSNLQTVEARRCIIVVPIVSPSLFLPPLPLSRMRRKMPTTPSHHSSHHLLGSGRGICHEQHILEVQHIIEVDQGNTGR